MSRLTDKLHEQSRVTGVTQAMIARELNVTQQAINNLFNGRAASSAYWREIAKLLSISEDEMRELMIDAGRDPERNTRLPTRAEETIRLVDSVNPPNPINPPQMITAPVMLPDARIVEQNLPISRPGRMLPILGEAVGGVNGEYLFNGNVLDYVACPPSLANVSNAYGVFVDGESMSPRYRPGEVVYVHPGKPPRRGDDVIVQIHSGEEGMPPHGFIKEFVGWSGDRLVLHQYNPEARIEFDRPAVVSVHPIILSGKYY